MDLVDLADVAGDLVDLSDVLVVASARSLDGSQEATPLCTMHVMLVLRLRAECGTG